MYPRRNFLGENKLGKKKEKKISDNPPLPGVDRQTPVNLLPWPNFVAAGNYTIPNLDLGDNARKQFNETSG